MLPESLVASALFSQCVSYCVCHRCFLCSHDFCHLSFHYDAYLRFTAFAFLISCFIVLVFLSVGVVKFIALASLLLAHWLHYPLCRCHRYWYCYHRCSSWYRCVFSSLLCFAKTQHVTCLRAAHQKNRVFFTPSLSAGKDTMYYVMCWLAEKDRTQLHVLFAVCRQHCVCFLCSDEEGAVFREQAWDKFYGLHFGEQGGIKVQCLSERLGRKQLIDVSCLVRHLARKKTSGIVHLSLRK